MAVPAIYGWFSVSFFINKTYIRDASVFYSGGLFVCGSYLLSFFGHQLCYYRFDSQDSEYGSFYVCEIKHYLSHKMRCILTIRSAMKTFKNLITAGFVIQYKRIGKSMASVFQYSIGIIQWHPIYFCLLHIEFWICVMPRSYTYYVLTRRWLRLLWLYNWSWLWYKSFFSKP